MDSSFSGLCHLGQYLFFVMTREIYGWPPDVTIMITGASVFVLSLVSGLSYVLTWSKYARQAHEREA